MDFINEIGFSSAFFVEAECSRVCWIVICILRFKGLIKSDGSFKLNNITVNTRYESPLDMEGAPVFRVEKSIDIETYNARDSSV